MATWGTGISLKGVDGSKIFFITGAPTDTNASARPGDTAFATDTFMFYQRTSTGWPAAAQGALLRGAMGINGVNGNFYAGTGAPASTLGPSGNSVYIQTTGEVWIRQDGGSWVDSGENLTGAQGLQGVAGQRGTQTYTGTGAPSTNLASFTPPAVAGDLYYDLSGGPTLYVLGS